MVVGAGLAGMRSAERLRELHFDGEIVIVGRETLGPYHRPALSKQYISGQLTDRNVNIPAADDLDAVWRLDTAAHGVDPASRVVHLPGGELLSYDGLIIASGVEARRLSNGQHGHPRVITMRTVSDARQLKRSLIDNRKPVAVIGTGFTGCELASTLRGMGREVVLIGRSRHLMSNVLGEHLSQQLTDLHRRHGVQLVLGLTVAKWFLESDSVTLQMFDGSTIAAACVVVAVGTIPTTQWLSGSGISVDDGVLCEATTHVIGTEDVVAAGDVAKWPNLHFDTVARRTEHWTNAVEMGRAAAEGLLAGRQFARPFMPLPRFWSEQHGARIQAIGSPTLGSEQVLLSPRDGLRQVVGYLRNQQMVGAIGINCAGAVLQHTKTIMRSSPVVGRLQPQTQFSVDVSAEGTQDVTANATPSGQGVHFDA